MRPLLTLLLLLLLPALVLPVGATLCLCTLLGDGPGEMCRSPCCTDCCSEPAPVPVVPAFRSLEARDCCLSLPDAPTINPKHAKRSVEKPGIPDDIRVEGVPPPAVASAPRRLAARADARWRDPLFHPPPLSARCSPLLL